MRYDELTSGRSIREYVWLGSTPVAMFTPDPANAANPPIAFYVHVDHINTPRVVTDTTGNIRWRWIAEPFGTTAPETNPSGLGAFTQNLRFPGQYADQESGLSYNYFRSLDPTIGRYNSSDPIGLRGGINTYAYVSGNPLSGIDPQGTLDLRNQGPVSWRKPGPGDAGMPCATAECAAGILPVSKPSPSACFTACFVLKTGSGILIGKGTGILANGIGPRVGAVTELVMNSKTSLTVSEAIGVSFCAEHCGYQIPPPSDPAICEPDPMTGVGCCWYK